MRHEQPGLCVTRQWEGGGEGDEVSLFSFFFNERKPSSVPSYGERTARFCVVKGPTHASASADTQEEVRERRNLKGGGLRRLRLRAPSLRPCPG